jgi:ubiquinone/menaquinone biosynthesis C-methylase UbiE
MFCSCLHFFLVFPMTDATYIGNELALFEKARNWKRYYASFLKPYLQGRVLEVGAGLGGTTTTLCDGSQRDWVCLEPDPALAVHISEKISNGNLPACCRVQVGFLADLPADEKFDVAIYIDVLEHIEHDGAQLEETTRYLKPGGYVVVLSPAYQWLFSPFDTAIGHYRRYTRKTLLAAAPNTLRLVRAFHLDSLGLCTSAVNKVFLKQSQPTPDQIALWDTVIVPCSKITDFLIGYNAGRSVIAVWQFAG